MKENFEKNNNPFYPFGTIGRLGFFITNTLVVIFYHVLLYFSCPTLIKNIGEPLLTNNYSQFAILLNNAPMHEIFIFAILVLVLMALKFIVAKKRIMDIAGNADNIVRNSYLIAFGIALLSFMGSFVVPATYWVNTFLMVTSVIITLYLIFQKGANQVNK